MQYQVFYYNAFFADTVSCAFSTFDEARSFALSVGASSVYVLDAQGHNMGVYPV